MEATNPTQPAAVVGQAVLQGSEPDARLLCRKERDTSRGSPRSFARQRTLAQDDNQTDTLPGLGTPCFVEHGPAILPTYVYAGGMCAEFFGRAGFRQS